MQPCNCKQCDKTGGPRRTIDTVDKSLRAVIKRATKIQEDRRIAEAYNPPVRASDAEREDAVAKLRLAASEGRLSPDELGDRVRWALQAKTRAEVAMPLSDLPETRSIPDPQAENRAMCKLFTRFFFYCLCLIVCAWIAMWVLSQGAAILAS